MQNFLATALRKMTSSAEEDLQDLHDVVHGKLEHKRSRTGSIALSRNLVKDFADLLRTGLYINIGVRTRHYGLAARSFSFDVFAFTFAVQQLDRSETSMVFAQLDHANVQLTFNNDADYPTPEGVPDKIAFWRVRLLS